MTDRAGPCRLDAAPPTSMRDLGVLVASSGAVLPPRRPRRDGGCGLPQHARAATRAGARHVRSVPLAPAGGSVWHTGSRS